MPLTTIKDQHRIEIMITGNFERPAYRPRCACGWWGDTDSKLRSAAVEAGQGHFKDLAERTDGLARVAYESVTGSGSNFAHWDDVHPHVRDHYRAMARAIADVIATDQKAAAAPPDGLRDLINSIREHASKIAQDCASTVQRLNEYRDEAEAACSHHIETVLEQCNITEQQLISERQTSRSMRILLWTMVGAANHTPQCASMNMNAMSGIRSGGECLPTCRAIRVELGLTDAKGSRKATGPEADGGRSEAPGGSAQGGVGQDLPCSARPGAGAAEDTQAYRSPPPFRADWP